jgi:predicted membrane protein DUF2142
VRHERGLILAFCFLAALRVFVFSAAFPFFNNVDERAHVDLVFKYANGDFPRGLPHFSPEAVRYLWLYASPEYLIEPSSTGDAEFSTPFWTLPPETIADMAATAEPQLKERINHEASDPPLYYAIMGLWLQFGRWCGLEGGRLLYWIRFLNVPVAAGLVWIAYISTRLIFPERITMRLVVPTLVAFFPQDNLYSVQSDAWSPLFYGLALIGTLKMLRGELSIFSATLAGLALAAACLTKTVNLPLLGIVAAFALLTICRQFRERKLHEQFASFVSLAVTATVPVILWMAWNRYAFGDLTGTAAKIDNLGWTMKTIGDWWRHPIFWLHGLGEFWSQLLARFWRGELIWKMHPLACPVADAFYWISSSLVLVATLTILIGQFDLSNFQRRALWLCFSSFVALVAVLAVLSIAFDFGNCVYPSREHPYFTSGRLLSAATIPFLLLYAFAFDYVANRVKWKSLTFLACGVTVLVIVVSEVTVNAQVFQSPYNFFHMWQ